MNTIAHNKYFLIAEYKRWEIVLSSLKNENTFLMLKLSEVLDRKVGKDFILKAEYFQNEFIVKDGYVKEMENDIKAELLLISNANDEITSTKIVSRYKKFKNELSYFERNFLNLKSDFDKSVAMH